MKIHSYQAKGKRAYMEDEIIILEGNRFSVTAVFDGHGGGACSKLLKTHFYPVFKKTLSETNDIRKALYNSLMKINAYVCNKKITSSGSTCNILVVDKREKHFYVANIGDSRCILSSGNALSKQISTDHKPNTPGEWNMIHRKGGFVKDNRVNGILSMSRAIGDLYISRYISSVPDIYHGPTTGVLFFIQASDGLLDVMSNKEICAAVKKLLRKGEHPDKVLRDITMYAILKRNSMDNVSVILTII